MLHYQLTANNLITGNPEERLARPVNVTVKTLADLIRDITGPGSILKPTESEAVISDYWGQITDYLRQGQAYSDDHISIYFSLRGLFNGDEDRFDPERHALVILNRLKKSVTGVASEVPLVKVEAEVIAPEMEHVYDWHSNTTDEALTPGDVLEIEGSELKIYGHLEEEGVFFVSQSGESEYKASQLRVNEPKRLILRIPGELPPGAWRLEVRNTRYDGKTLRTGIFPSALKVE